MTEDLLAKIKCDSGGCILKDFIKRLRIDFEVNLSRYEDKIVEPEVVLLILEESIIDILVGDD